MSISFVISYRFMVMDRFGKDLQKIFEESGKRFTRKTVLQLGLRILDVLEYVHEHEYVHGDIKASNLLLSYKVPHQVYLVDYGLAYRYCPEGIHKVYKEDPKRCHDGTLEYTSIDAHNGVDEIAEYMERVMSLNYTEKPPYQQLREILLKGLKDIGQKDDGILDFGVSENGEVPAKPALKDKYPECRRNRAGNSIGKLRAEASLPLLKLIIGIICIIVFVNKARRKLVAATVSAASDEDDAETVSDDEKNVRKRKRTSPKAGWISGPPPFSSLGAQGDACNTSAVVSVADRYSPSIRSSHLMQPLENVRIGDGSNQAQSTEDLSRSQDKQKTKEEDSELEEPE
ncbi:hypothetical protein lerEdw1_013010 [Lerista edwardsae]|nr:hypothetical protein lerEdw1_013010 [Lerista edwardsae]